MFEKVTKLFGKKEDEEMAKIDWKKALKGVAERAEKFTLRVKVDDSGFHYIRKAVAEDIPGFYDLAKVKKLEEKKAKLKAKLEALEKEEV